MSHTATSSGKPRRFITFNEVPADALFRMFAGRWTMQKLTNTTAQRVRDSGLDLACEFEGTERCLLVGEVWPDD